MAVKIRRSYKGAATSAVLDSSGVSSATQTSISLTTSPSNWPTGKFFVVVAPGTAQEEKMCVTLSGSTLTVVSPSSISTSPDKDGRGIDDTTARSTITAGSTVYPVFTAIDADEANQLTSTYANQGGIVYQGASTFTQLAIGTAGQVLKVNSTANAPEWGTVGAGGIADGAVTEAALAPNAVTSGKIANGAIVNDDINASAAIAYSKLSLNNSIVASDLTSNSVTTAKIVDANVTNAKLDYTTVPQITVSSSSPTGGKNGDIWIVV